MRWHGEKQVRNASGSAVPAREVESGIPYAFCAGRYGVCARVVGWWRGGAQCANVRTASLPKRRLPCR